MEKDNRFRKILRNIGFSLRNIQERTIHITIISLLCLGIVGAASLLGAEKTTGDRNRQDIRQIVKGLEIHHPDLFYRGDRDAFYQYRNELISNAENLGDRDYYFSIKKLLAMLKDGHTTVYRHQTSDRYTYLKGIPVTFRNFGGTWVLDKVPEKFRQYVGADVLSINDVPMDEIFASYKEYMSLDNDNNAIPQFINEAALYSFLEMKGIAKNGEPVKLELIENWQYVDITVEPGYLDDIEKMTRKSIQTEYPLVTYRTGDHYRSTSLSNTVYFIQVNSLLEMPGKTFQDFSKKLAYDIGRGYYKAVIVDLRYTSGGDSTLISSLISDLKSLKAEEGFEVYTLISGETFSSGVTAAYRIRDELKSTVLGTNSGGNINSFTSQVVVQPNYHNFSVLVPTDRLDLLKGYQGDSLIPNVEIQPTLKDIRYGIDTPIKWITDRN